MSQIATLSVRFTRDVNAEPRTNVRLDDSAPNVVGAARQGWKGVHFVELFLDEPACADPIPVIHKLEDLRDLFPQFFSAKSS